MLIRFGVENHYSIRDYQEMLLAASAIKDEAAEIIESEAINEKLLPAAAIYGANGSGKTNILNALVFLKRAILNSHIGGSSESEIPVQPFLLDKGSRELPSKFDCDFILRNVRYTYGIALDKKRVTNEYLYSYPKRHKQVWFERDHDDFHFGRHLQGENRAIQNLTRSNSLFLSAAETNNHKQLSPIFSYFKNNIVFYDELPSFGYGTFKDYGFDEDRKRDVLRLLNTADFGIVGMDARPREESEFRQKIITDLSEVVRKHIGGRSAEVDDALALERERIDITLMHKGKDGDSYPLDLASESRGTQTYLNLLAPIIRALRRGQVIVVDELDTSLHTLLARKILSLFNSKQSNPHGAQLLFTTHDTNLLSPRSVRRDQVWFTERSHDGATLLYPLTDISVRKNDDFEKGYLQGRYGAVPIVGDISQQFDVSSQP